MPNSQPVFKATCCDTHLWHLTFFMNVTVGKWWHTIEDPAFQDSSAVSNQADVMEVDHSLLHRALRQGRSESWTDRSVFEMCLYACYILWAWSFNCILAACHNISIWLRSWLLILLTGPSAPGCRGKQHHHWGERKEDPGEAVSMGSGRGWGIVHHHS